MKIFEYREISQAVEFAKGGGQAIHLMPGAYAYGRNDTPSCFKGRKQIAHLFDQDKARLVKTAKRLGVRVIKVEREADPGQHIDLCGRPLERALSEAKQIDWEQSHGIL